MNDPQAFQAAAIGTRIAAFWGMNYDTDLMAALCSVDDAELFMKQDFIEIERRIEAGELTRELWSRESGEALLLDARECFAAIRSRIEDEHGTGEASRVIVHHLERMEDWRFSTVNACPEIAVIVIMSDWLRHADGGEIPSHSRIANLIESLKAYAPFFRDGTTNDEKRRLANSEILRPMQNLVVWRMERTPYIPGGKKPSATYAKQLEEIEEIARFIFDHGLFIGEQVRIDRWLRKTEMPLTPGADKSRSLFGAVRVRRSAKPTE